MTDTYIQSLSFPNLILLYIRSEQINPITSVMSFLIQTWLTVKIITESTIMQPLFLGFFNYIGYLLSLQFIFKNLKYVKFKLILGKYKESVGIAVAMRKMVEWDL